MFTVPVYLGMSPGVQTHQKWRVEVHEVPWRTYWLTLLGLKILSHTLRSDAPDSHLGFWAPFDMGFSLQPAGKKI